MARKPPKQAPRPAQAAAQEAERESLEAEEQWLDLIADIIVEDLLNEERR